MRDEKKGRLRKTTNRACPDGCKAKLELREQDGQLFLICPKCGYTDEVERKRIRHREREEVIMV